MRRRLWWSLVLFDSRIGEMAADHRSTLLTPYGIPRPPEQVGALTADQTPLTEALFVVVRSEVADFVRHSAFHLDFTYLTSEDDFGDLTSLERMMEEKYLKFTHLEIPFQFMATWMARGYLAEFLLMEHHSRYSTTCPTDDQRDTGICLAMRRLESDTKFMSSPLTRRYIWLLDFHLPFPAYVHIFQDLKRRPLCRHAGRAWKVLSDNFTIRSRAHAKLTPYRGGNPLHPRQ
ncbi:hypothetical protein N7532_003312 [Penicillium argentinense]|uniref:Transcription factor domain-containing protein n=1 Tax=Penicillium argentinense TaxID=1131581 RepID=A0A9W9FMC1_9EURO|nr:uncharacterized protein N7532_003312 [Penicillium argentinense]KAJ5102783.1 hypothetical protein N7532_003312 [Penicillium argentinense]